MELQAVHDIPHGVTTSALPDPEVEPTIRLWPDAGKLYKLGRSATYEAAARGDIPGAFQVGTQWRVRTATLRRALGLEES